METTTIGLKDRRAQMRILFIPLETPTSKSNDAMSNRIRLLSGRNELIGVKRAAQFRESATYMKFFLYTVKTFFYGLRHRKEFDLIYCFELSTALAGLSISLFTGKPCVIETTSVTREWLQRIKPSIFLTGALSVVDSLVKRFASMLIVLSEADRRAYIEQGFDPDKIVAIPLPPDLSLADEVADDREALRRRLGLGKSKKILIFTGSSRDFPPNMEAVEWINWRLAPVICQRFNDTQILVTGSGETPEPVHPIVTFTGFVPSLFEYICASDAFIAPQERLSGYLTKVFDSLSCAKPTVVMASATNGIPELVNGNNAMVAKDMNEFIEKTIYLLEHPDEAQAIGIRGRKMLEENYSWSIWKERLNEVLERCLVK